MTSHRHRKLPAEAPEVPSSVAFILIATDLARKSANPDCATVCDADITPDNKLDADSFLSHLEIVGDMSDSDL